MRAGDRIIGVGSKFSVDEVEELRRVTIGRDKLVKRVMEGKIVGNLLAIQHAIPISGVENADSIPKGGIAIRDEVSGFVEAFVSFNEDVL